MNRAGFSISYIDPDLRHADRLIMGGCTEGFSKREPMKGAVHRSRSVQWISVSMNRRRIGVVDRPDHPRLACEFYGYNDDMDLPEGTTTINLAQEPKLADYLLGHLYHLSQFEKNGNTSGEK
jgi:hypothetical protein